MCQRRPAVVLKRSEHRVNAHDIAVNAVLYPARRSRIADKIVAGRFNDPENIGGSPSGGVVRDYCINERFGAANNTMNSSTVAGNGAVGNRHRAVSLVIIAVGNSAAGAIRVVVARDCAVTDGQRAAVVNPAAKVSGIAGDRAVDDGQRADVKNSPANGGAPRIRAVVNGVPGNRAVRDG